MQSLISPIDLWTTSSGESALHKVLTEGVCILLLFFIHLHSNHIVPPIPTPVPSRPPPASSPRPLPHPLLPKGKGSHGGVNKAWLIE